MFLRINNDYAQMLIKIDNIIKIIGRPGPVDNPDIKEEWEVGVFTQDERQALYLVMMIQFGSAIMKFRCPLR